MGVFAKLLGRSSRKSTEEAAQATPPEETGKRERTREQGDGAAREGSATTAAGACAGSGETGSGETADKDEAATTACVPGEQGKPGGTETAEEAAQESGEPTTAKSGEGEVPGARHKDAAEPGKPSAAQGPGTDEDMDTSDATVESGDGVGIPKQQSAEEAADSETGENARK